MPDRRGPLRVGDVVAQADGVRPDDLPPTVCDRLDDTPGDLTVGEGGTGGIVVFGGDEDDPVWNVRTLNDEVCRIERHETSGGASGSSVQGSAGRARQPADAARTDRRRSR